MNRAREIEEQAARWIVRREQAEWSQSDQQALDQWLESSMAHKAAFWRLEFGWISTDRLAAVSNGLPSRYKKGVSYWLGAAAAIILVVGIATHFWAPWSQDSVALVKAATVIGQRKEVRLADGSSIQLNTNSAIRADFHKGKREVWLDRGEAFFDVFHDPSRPFVVHAAGRTVTVLGTRFALNEDQGALRLVVERGAVRLDSPSTNRRVQSAIVRAGGMAIAKSASILVVSDGPDRVRDALSWRNGMITFENSTLSDAAREFNRYNKRKIVILDDRAANLKIGGSFEVGNVGAFTRLLQDAFGLHVRNNKDEIQISS